MFRLDNYQWLYILILSSCIAEQRIPSPYDVGEPSSFIEINIPNSNNSDNTIYRSKAIHQYNYQYFDSTGREQRIVVSFNDKCLEDRTVNCNDWGLFPLDSLEFLASDRFYPIDYIEMYVCESTMNSSLAEEQTIIKYSYFNNENGRILFGELTGLIEDTEQLFLHPPRMYGFSILELVPFPYIKLPLNEGNEWETNISIPQKMVEKTRLGLSSSLYLNSAYFVDTVSQSDPIIAEIHATNTDNEGNVYSTARFSYDSKRGITRIECENVDSSKLILYTSIR